MSPAASPRSGLAPSSWAVRPLGDIAIVGSGGTPSRSRPEYWNGDVPWVTTAEVDFNTIERASEQITETGLRNSAAKLLPPGTLLMALYGQGKTRGKVAVLGIAAATNQACASIRVGPGASPEFVRYYLESQYDAIRNASNAGSQDNLSGQIVKQLPILLPSLAEQRAIAAALSDVDALITALEQLIAKKRDLKIATMQQLLTGQRRLPGFTGAWETKRLGSLGDVYGGLAGKAKEHFGRGNARYVTFLNVINNVVLDLAALERVEVSASEAQNRIVKGDLFFNGSSETANELGVCAVLAEPVDEVYLNSFCFGFRVRSDAPADPLFLAYLFRSAVGRQLIYALAQGAIRYNLAKATFLRLQLHLPSKEEQVAIAAALRDCDAELAALVARRDKTKLIKQGMMQELLPGRTRLVEATR